MQNIPSGGVGEAYPGSNGGEIFNCYEGVSRNVASGNYSTAIGKNCKAVGSYSFAGGQSCTANGNYNICLGYDSYTIGSDAICIGHSVKKGNGAATPSHYMIGIGRAISIGDETIAIGYDIGHSYPTFMQGIYIGKNLKADNYSISTTAQLAMIGSNLITHRAVLDPTQTNPNAFIIGQYNDPYTPDALFVIGCGNSNTRKNGLILTSTKCKLINDLQLNTDDTAVNAITPPTDPSNPTIDEKTLATKAYVASQVPSLAALQGITFKRTYTAVTGQITALTPNTDNNLETLFSITIPSWASHMIIGYDISMMQSYVRIALDAIGANYPILMPDQDTSELYSFNLGWTPSTKELYVSYGHKWTAGIPAIDQNLTFSIMSIRFEGDYTPFPVNP